MKGSISPLKLESVIGRRKFKLIDDFVVRLDDGRTFTAPRGFETDLISSPRWLWGFINPAGRGREAAVIHDYLLDTGHVRKECDYIFRDILELMELRPGIVKSMFWGVRCKSKQIKLTES